MPNWSAKVEYLYYDLGSLRVNIGPVFGSAWNFEPGASWVYASSASSWFNGNIDRAGLNYRFNY